MMQRSLNALIVLLAIGCGSDSGPPPVPLYPVSGVVTFNGRPVAEADVTFFNAEQNRSAFGRTDDEGKYSLTTFTVKDGAVAGNHAVTIAKYVSTTPPPPEPDVESEAYEPPKEGYDPPEAKADSGLPEKYADPGSSGLTATVDAGGANEFNFEL